MSSTLPDAGDAPNGRHLRRPPFSSIASMPICSPMRLELGSIKVANGRAEWAAAVILLVPFAGIIVLLSALGMGFGVLLGVTMAFGIPVSGARIRLARYLRDRWAWASEEPWGRSRSRR